MLRLRLRVRVRVRANPSPSPNPNPEQADLAKLYDMLLHQETPPGATRAHRACAATQQLVRAAIEAHPRADEIATLWQQFSHAYKGGYAGYLPSLVSAVR